MTLCWSDIMLNSPPVFLFYSHSYFINSVRYYTFVSLNDTDINILDIAKLFN